MTCVGAPPAGTGPGVIIRQLSVLGLYAAPSNTAGSPQSEPPPAAVTHSSLVAGNPDHTTSSSPVHADTGDVRGPSGDTTTDLVDAKTSVDGVVTRASVVAAAGARVVAAVATDGSNGADELADGTDAMSTADPSSPSPQPATNTPSVTANSPEHSTPHRQPPSGCPWDVRKRRAITPGPRVLDHRLSGRRNERQDGGRDHAGETLGESGMAELRYPLTVRQ